MAGCVAADKFRGFVITIIRVIGSDGLPYYTPLAKDPLGDFADDVTQCYSGDWHGKFHKSINGALLEIKLRINRELNELTE